MKTKLSRVGKSSLSLILSVMMIFSTMLIGTITTANAATFTSDGNAILYFNPNPSSASTWSQANAQLYLYFFNGSNYKWSEKATLIDTSHAYVKVPEGDWANVILTRMNPDASGNPSWNNKWGQTGNLTMGSNNYVANFNYDSTTCTWNTYIQTSGAKLEADATEVATDTAVTLTPSLTSNQTFNDLKSTSYSVKKGSSDASSSDYSIDGDRITFNTAGTYTVTATVTYNAKGFTNITKTADASCDITVKQSALNNISAKAQHTDDGTTYTDGGATVTINGETGAVDGVDPQTGVTVSAVADAGYEFVGWTSENGSFNDTTAAETTFIPTVDGAVAVAQFKKQYSISGKAGANGSVTPSAETVLAGDSYTLNITAESGYKLEKLLVNNDDVTSSVSNGVYTATATSDVTYSASFTEAKYIRIYLAAPSGWDEAWSTMSVTDNISGNKVASGSHAYLVSASPQGSAVGCTGDKIGTKAVNGTNRLVSYIDIPSECANWSQFYIGNADGTFFAAKKFDGAPQYGYCYYITGDTAGAYCEATTISSPKANNSTEYTCYLEDSPVINLSSTVNKKNTSSGNFTAGGTTYSTYYTITDETGKSVELDKNAATWTPTAVGTYTVTVKLADDYTSFTATETAQVIVKNKTSYAIKLVQPENGSAEVSSESAFAGEDITVTVSANAGYKVNGITITKTEDGSDADVTVTESANGTYTFTMPEYAVTVTPSVVEKAKYDITLDYNADFGTVTSSTHTIVGNKITGVTEGTTVTLKAVGIGDYSFSGWGVTGSQITTGTAKDAEITITVNDATLVKATFSNLDYALVASNGTEISSMSKVKDGVYVSTATVDTSGVTANFTIRDRDGKFAISKATGDTSWYLTATNYKDAYSDNVKSFDSTIHNYFYNNSGKARYVVYDSNTHSVYLVDDPSLKQTYKIYAKNGTVAEGGTKDYGVTKVTSGVIDSEGTSQSGYTEYMASEGSIITIQTTVNDTYRTAGNYVYAYCVNGKTVLAQQTEPGVYTASYTVEGSNTQIEITPVYFNSKIEEAGDYITFYVDASELEGLWGNTVALYTYYYKTSDVSNKNAYYASAYPGQPMLQNKDGLYYIKVPRYYYQNGEKLTGYNGDNSLPYAVSGMTINNYGEESLHKTLLGAKPADGSAVANRQSYDFKDFAVLAEQGYDTIMFQTKYRTHSSNQYMLLNNATNAPDLTGRKIDLQKVAAENGWDDFTDYFTGDATDVLGYKVDESQTKGLYVISTGNQQTSVGVWSTEWYVFDQDGNFIVQGNPNDFILSDEDTAEGSTNRIWNALKDYKGAKTHICYESEMKATTSVESGNSGIRVDGRWYYTKAEEVKVNIETAVQYSEDHGVTYQYDNNTNTENTGYIGEVTGAKATINDATSYEFPLNATNAVLSASSTSMWVFQGWYAVTTDADGNETFTEYDKDSMSAIELVTGAYTKFVARYIRIGEGQLVLTHTAYDGPDKLGGRGTYYMRVVLTHEDGTTSSFDYTTGAITIPLLQSDKSIEVSLRTICAGNNTFYSFYDMDGDKYEPFVDEEGELVGKTGTVDYSFVVSPKNLFSDKGDQLVKALNYFSDISPVTGDAVLNYKYKNRFDQDRTYTVTVKLDDTYYDNDKKAYVIDASNPEHQKLIMDHAPAIDDLHKDCLWSIERQTPSINGTNVVLNGIQTGKKFNVTLNYYEDGAEDESELVIGESVALPLNSYIKDETSGDFYKTAANLGTKKFLYWSVVNDKNLEVARCYSEYFTLRITDNVTITPVYGEELSSYLSIGNATYTREQYTEGGKNYDYLYADFIVAYMSADSELLNQSSDYKTGVIVELNQNAKVTQDNVNDGKTFDEVGSTVNYAGITFVSSEDQIKNLATGSSTQSNYKNSEGVNNIAYKFEINNAGYNNKNRLDYYVKFKNSKAYRSYVMKAYYYVYKVDESGNMVEGSYEVTEPVYFNLYNIGNSETAQG